MANDDKPQHKVTITLAAYDQQTIDTVLESPFAYRLSRVKMTPLPLWGEKVAQ